MNSGWSEKEDIACKNDLECASFEALYTLTGEKHGRNAVSRYNTPKRELSPNTLFLCFNISLLSATVSLFSTLYFNNNFSASVPK